MAKQPTYQPSEAELEILQIIWEIEPASVRAIHERITAAGKNVGYTTVLKQIQPSATSATYGSKAARLSAS